MAGIYLHIPFCKQACHYCNFHFSTSLQLREQMVEAILLEMEMNRDYLVGQPVSSIYFGGGTPSLLPIADIERLINRIYQLNTVESDAEITLESNPDDMSEAWLKDLKTHTPVNRLSIGVQSFHEADLHWMNRAHNAGHARNCIELALANDFDNLTIDLIYGGPTLPDEKWAENLKIAFDYRIPHLSCYSMTVEEGTALHHFIQKGKVEPVEEERSARQLEYLMEATAKTGYEQYEISNFALPGHYAKHNSSYWLGGHYLGLGPSAHSYNGRTRQWNVAHNPKYITGVLSGDLLTELEVLTPANRFNEYVMTMLRTQWGCKIEQLTQLNPTGAELFEKGALDWIEKGDMTVVGGVYKLTLQGRLLADRIAAHLFTE